MSTIVTVKSWVGCSSRKDMVEVGVGTSDGEIVFLRMFPRQARKLIDLLELAHEQAQALGDEEEAKP